MAKVLSDPPGGPSGPPGPPRLFGKMAPATLEISIFSGFSLKVGNSGVAGAMFPKNMGPGGVTTVEGMY